jgi:hypothetical protein
MMHQTFRVIIEASAWLLLIAPQVMYRGQHAGVCSNLPACHYKQPCSRCHRVPRSNENQ